jgi:hypothetical protein
MVQNLLVVGAKDLDLPLERNLARVALEIECDVGADRLDVGQLTSALAHELRLVYRVLRELLDAVHAVERCEPPPTLIERADVPAEVDLLPEIRELRAGELNPRLLGLLDVHLEVSRPRTAVTAEASALRADDAASR